MENVRLFEKYSLEEFKNLISEYLDPVTAELIYNKFMFRYISENEIINNVDIWELHFLNHLERIYKQYKEYIRIETVKADWMVWDYLERELKINDDSSETNSGTNSNTTTGTTTAADGGSDRKTYENTNTLTGTDTSEYNGSYTDTRSEDVEAGGKQLNKSMPQTMTYSGSGFPSSLSWADPSAQTESKSNSDTDISENGSNENETTATTSRNGTDSGTETYTHGKTTNTSVINETSGENAGERNVKSEHIERVRQTGRSGVNPAIALETARKYIKETNAANWLIDELQEHFIYILYYE